jgi:hypothetical protein
MRNSDALLGPGKGPHTNHQTSMVNVITGGQMGLVTNLKTYVQNASYVRRNVVAILMEAPTGFNDLPEPEVWQGLLKALVETAPRSIEGLRGTVNVQYTETPIGGAGEMQEDISKATRERSQPTFVWTEKYGMPVNAFFDGWIRYLIQDPETGIPLVSTLTNRQPMDQLPDYTGMTVLFFEPDPMFKTVQKAWLITNMMPKTAGEYVGSRDITQGGQTVDYNIEFTGIQQLGAGVIALAQQQLDEIMLTGVNPNRREAFLQQISADVRRGEGGYKESIQLVASEQI